MKKWLPILIVCLIVLGLRLPKYIMKKKVDRSTADLVASGKPNGSVNRTQTNTRTPLPPLAGSTYTNPDLGFSIVFPQGWTVKDALSSEAIVIKAVRQGEHHKFAALNIYAWELDGTVEFASMTPRQFFDQTYGDKGQLLDSGTEIVNGYRAVWMKMNLTSMGLPSYALTYALVHDDILFSVHANTVMGDYSWFEENGPDMLKSIRSFRFTK